MEKHDFHDFSVHKIESWGSTPSLGVGLRSVAGKVGVNQKRRK